MSLTLARLYSCSILPTSEHYGFDGTRAQCVERWVYDHALRLAEEHPVPEGQKQMEYPGTYPA